MMKSTTKQSHWLVSLLSLVFLLAGLTACSSSEGDDNGNNPSKPDTPISNNDWQTVPATGGTIEKDSLSVTFPSGTYSEDAEVAITEVRKGEIGGELEASKFYQIAMPCTANKPITIKMKSNVVDDNICFVAQANAYCTSTCEFTKREIHYETTYSNGEYTATIPAIMGDNQDENLYFTIGLGRIIDPESGKARTRGILYRVIEEGKVKNVHYQLRYYWTLWDEATWRLVGDKNYEKAVIASVTINSYVQQAIEKILDLGFKVDDGKTIYLDFNPNEKDWGGFQIVGLPGIENGWNTYIDLGRYLFLDKYTIDQEEITEDQKRCTILHEIFHWFQNFYDPRTNYRKACGGDEETVMCEMGAVWIEHLMNNGQVNAQWLMKEVLSECYEDKMGLTDIKERFGMTKNVNGNYQKQGYTMGPLLFYLCSTDEMKAFDFKQKSVLELHEYWGKFFTHTKTNSYQTIPTANILERWSLDLHDSHFFSGDQIDKYYLKLLKGELVKGLDCFSSYEWRHKNKAKISGDFVLDKIIEKGSFEGTNWPYGYAFKSIQLKGLKDISLKDKNLVIKQETGGMQTYVLASDLYEKNFVKIGSVAKGEETIVIPGSTLESFRKSDGTFDHFIFLVTTRTENSLSDKGSKPWKVTFELKDEEEEPQAVQGKVRQLDYYLVFDVKQSDGSISDRSSFGFEHYVSDNPRYDWEQNGSTVTVKGTCDIEANLQFTHNEFEIGLSNFSGDLSNCTITYVKGSQKYHNDNPHDLPNHWIIGDIVSEHEYEVNCNVKPCKIKTYKSGERELYFDTDEDPNYSLDVVFANGSGTSQTSSHSWSFVEGECKTHRLTMTLVLEP